MTFAISYVAPSEAKMDEYQRDHAPRLQADHSSRFQGRFAAFRTLLTIIEEYK